MVASLIVVIWSVYSFLFSNPEYEKKENRKRKRKSETRTQKRKEEKFK